MGCDQLHLNFLKLSLDRKLLSLLPLPSGHPQSQLPRIRPCLSIQSSPFFRISFCFSLFPLNFPQMLRLSFLFFSFFFLSSFGIFSNTWTCDWPGRKREMKKKTNKNKQEVKEIKDKTKHEKQGQIQDQYQLRVNGQEPVMWLGRRQWCDWAGGSDVIGHEPVMRKTKCAWKMEGTTKNLFWKIYSDKWIDW